MNRENTRTLTVTLSGETFHLPLNQQLLIGLGLSVAEIITIPQWWHRTSGQKLVTPNDGKAWHWRDMVISALQRLKTEQPDLLRQISRGTE